MIRPVILCGGAGTRLWPVSRALFPKHLLPFMGQQSLLQETAARLLGEEFLPAIVVSSEDQRFLIKHQLDEAAAPVDAILLEPAARSTSAAAALAAAWVTSNGRDELLLLMPSDHVIQDREAFLQAIGVGVPQAEAGAIVTFGAQPTEPSTQYGYIEAATEDGSVAGVFPIARFVEKPSALKAAEHLATGHFYWNAGIFLLKASTLLEEMRKFLPQSLDAITMAMSNATTEGVFVRPEETAFQSAETISIDHGIMEKTSRGKVIPVQMGWSDIGSWDAVWKLGNKDENGNVTQGDVVSLDTRASLLRSESGGPLIAAVGLDQMAVIAAGDAVFVSPLNRVSDVKDVVAALKAEGRQCVVSPTGMARTSESYETVARTPHFQVKHVVVDPGEHLSHRNNADQSEHWIVIGGTAEVTIGDKISILHENETAHVPARTTHRIANTGNIPLELIEVQRGSDMCKENMDSQNKDLIR